MAIPKKGSRLLTVKGERYRWRIRHKPTYGQGIFDSGFLVAVERVAPPSRCVLLLEADFPRPDNWLGNASKPVTPQMIAVSIESALAQGWQPKLAGSAFMHPLLVGRKTSPGAAADGDVPRLKATNAGFAEIGFYGARVVSIHCRPSLIEIVLHQAVLRPRHPANDSKDWVKVTPARLSFPEVIRSEAVFWDKASSGWRPNPDLSAAVDGEISGIEFITTRGDTHFHVRVCGKEWRIFTGIFELSWDADHLAHALPEARL